MKRRIVLALALAVLGGCATLDERLPAGAPQEAVLHELGAPTARYAPLDGQPARWQYSSQPFGRSVINVDFDAAGRVLRAEEALNEGLMAQRIRPHEWTQRNVLREYGPPARTLGVANFEGTIWAWRYLNGAMLYELTIDIDTGGIVRGWTSSIVHPPEPRFRRR
ncbi:MAG: hypothetical protein IKH84_02060 [Ottowia sp.]|nr:hypothetical protein [Ottowia sp.]